MEVSPMTPEDLITRLQGKRVRISPVVEVKGPGGRRVIACDCSGCNNPECYIDMFHDGDPESILRKASDGQPVGFLVLTED